MIMNRSPPFWPNPHGILFTHGAFGITLMHNHDSLPLKAHLVHGLGLAMHQRLESEPDTRDERNRGVLPLRRAQYGAPVVLGPLDG